MRKKVHNLYFIPKSINFSDLEPHQEESLGYEEDHVMIEKQICQMVNSLSSDKERCVLFYQILREYGFNFDYDSCARSLDVNWRWYMRIKAQVQRKLQAFRISK